MRSASSTRVSASASARASVLLPLPAGPTRPTTNGASALGERRGRSAPSKRSVHIEPRPPRPDRHGERHAQWIAALHLALHQLGDARGVALGALDQKLVVDL